MIRDLGLEFEVLETSETHMSEAFEASESETSKSEALVSKTLEFRD
jgi:hypothetical protein